MFKPKSEIYNKLKTLPGVTVRQGAQTVFADTPAVTFRLDNNAVNLDLDKNIASQDIAVAVDIWADDSPTASNLLSEVEAKMRELNYRLSFSADVPAPEGALYHIATRFEAAR